MKKIFFLILFCASCYVHAQTAVTWSSPLIVNGAVGYTWPRVCVANSIPVLNWGDNLNSNIFTSRYLAGSFTAPVQLNPPGFQVVVSGLTGPDIKSSGDTVYVVYVDGSATHVYLQRSFDGGVTFSDTIKVDNIGNNIPQYATVGIMQNGNPVVAFAKLTASFNNPQYVVTKSFDAGSTFLPDVSATGSLGADPCDCCPGTITCSENKVAVIYRNSVNDLRDMRAALSTDTANSFSSLGIIDNNGWVIANCPASSASGIIIGDTLVSTFMNGLNGNSCYVSTYNINTLQSGFEKKLFDVPGLGNQNLPCIAGKGDTLGGVWEEIINGNSTIMFSYSTTGASGLGINVDTISDILPGGFHKNPNLAYENGKFYVVFSDAVAEHFYFMEGILTGGTGIQQHADDNAIEAFFTDDYSSIKIVNNGKVGQVTISISDVQGKAIENLQINLQKPVEVVRLNHPLTSGVYLVTVSGKDFVKSKKMAVQK